MGNPPVALTGQLPQARLKARDYQNCLVLIFYLELQDHGLKEEIRCHAYSGTFPDTGIAPGCKPMMSLLDGEEGSVQKTHGVDAKDAKN
jgi:hypothetical protein